ncbi:MAG: cytosolic protein [Streptococcus salivarius]
MITQAKTPQKTETSSSTEPASSSSSSTQSTVSESAQNDTKTVAGSTKTPAQQQDSGVPESSNDIMLNPEYHSHIDENGYNSLLGANVLDNNNGGNNSNSSNESSSMGSSE